MQAREQIDTELVVVGAGAAGLYAALSAASLGASVTVISATPLAQTASYWAQGGLAAALGADVGHANTFTDCRFRLKYARQLILYLSLSTTTNG